jgi:hypothetical protein
MRLPLEAVGDENDYTTYPAPLVSVGGARLLHIKAPDGWRRALCGVSADNNVEVIAGRPRPVCAKCRRRAGERT